MKRMAIAGALASALALIVGSVSVAATPVPAAGAVAPPTAPKLHAAMRALWHARVVASGDYALAVHAGNQAAAQRASAAANANAKQISDAVARFYGQPAGGALRKLLDGQWAGVKMLTDATKARNAADEQTAMHDLVSNAIAIAELLASANPDWTQGQLRGALMAYVDGHRTWIDEILTNAPQAEQAHSRDEMRQHANRLADALATGIAQQFPGKAD